MLQDVGPLADWTPKAGCQIPQPSPAECLFNWAELNYPGLFAPIGSPWTVSSIDWTFRYYSVTNAYLRIQSSDTHVYYQGPDGLSQDVGSLADWTPKASCRPPVANAGPDQTAFVGTTVTLDGSASSDLDGNLITYQWTLTQKPANSPTGLLNQTALHPTLAIDKPGTYHISLVVNDGQFASATATVTVNTQNSKPVANAGIAQSGKVGGTLALNGNASRDVDGDALTYRWTLPAKPQGSSAQLNNPNTISPSLTLDKPGSYTAQLTVNDGKADSTPSTIVLSTVNSKPEAKAGPAQTILLSTPAPSVQLDGSGSSDADSDPLSFHWALISKPAGSQSVLLDPLAPSSRFTPDFVGDYVAQLIVNDGHVDSDPSTTPVNVSAPPPPQNHPPQISTRPVLTASVGGSYSYDVNAGDTDNDTLTYNLSLFLTGMTINAQTGLINWTPGAGQTGPQAVTVNVTDGKGGSDSQTFTITVAAAGQITVPDVRDLSRAAAETAIQQAKLNLGTLSFEHNAKADGSVINQSPAANSSVAEGAAVNLTISLGPDQNLPPNPETVASRLDSTVATTTFAATEFLYSGPNPIQTGVQPGTIEARRVAVIRGRVLDKQNIPLSGVTVSILNHTELGQTLSRTDGMFDLAVNGGGYVTLNYRKDGYLPAQRQVSTPWQDYATVDDVVLIQLDSQVTEVNLTNTATAQVVRGNPVTDVDGVRQATLLFPAGTEATMILPDGSTQPMTTLHIRATEYTVGANGPSAMPGELPPSSGYTYAVELSADEVITSGATSVYFSQPVPFYVENFVGIPVGSLVPTGFYDRGKEQWVASDNGRVIKVLGTTGGLADLDLDGNGSADDAPSLAALSITNAERQRLATLYTPGQSLWRVLLPHLTPWDCNFPFGPPPGSQLPSDSGDPKPSPQPNKPPKDPCKQNGSIIGCETQTLGEVIGVAGTSLNLHYQSDRVPGNRDTNTLKIRLSGATLPPDLQRIHLEISIAGQVVKKNFAPQTNLVDTFTWDGKDAYGRPVQGQQPVKVRIGYAYIARYYTAPGSLVESFNRFGSQPISVGSGSGAGGGGGGAVAFSFQLVRTTTPPIILWQDYDESLGSIYNLGLGGWSLGIHHSYDVSGRKLYLGNGNQLSATAMGGAVITTVAGTGNFDGFAGDGGLATQATVSSPLGIAIGSDGSLFIADGSQRIRRVGPDGIITTVAGNGNFGFAGDGGPATRAQLATPMGVAVGPDGSLYIADFNNQRIRRVEPDGIITTVAGTGGAGFSGDGGLATQAMLNSPQGVAMGPDGSLYIADSNNQRIRRVAPDGIITTVAGTGVAGFAGDGGNAAQATLGFPREISVGSDGSLYIVDRGNVRIRRVGPDGIITTVAGSGVGFAGDGGAAALAKLSLPQGVAVGGNGKLYIADTNNNRIRRVGSDGIITTVAGTGNFGFTGDSGLATQARLRLPQGIAVGPDTSLYIADSENHRIRKVYAPLV